MSLRTRLIIAFLVMSVVPLSAVTLFWYMSSVSAFERAAQKEAAQSAADIARRIEMITTDVGQRMDRLFEGPEADSDLNPDPDAVRKRVAPLLGETAALIERVEFHPAEASDAPRHADFPPPPPQGRREHPEPAGSPLPPKPPAPPGHRGVIVVDVPQIMEQARQTARSATDGTLPQLGPLIDSAMQNSKVQAAIAAAAEATKEASAKALEATSQQMAVEGQHVEVAVRKKGKLLGKANATINLDRMLRTVLPMARRDQGEIAFAIDRKGTVFTPNEADRPRLQLLGVAQLAPVAARSGPRRTGDWVVVARGDPRGLTLGIARPIGESLREIRSMSFRNLSMGLAVIALACIGIVPISHRMTHRVSELSAGVRQLASGDFKTRVPVQSQDEFGALAASFNRMAADLERHQALVVEQERLRRELELSRLIQTEMLPRAPLRLGPAEIKGVSIPAREVGGDFFNYFALPDGRMALLVGDVSGKGVSAALLMANIQATLRARLPLETDLQQLADHLDREVDQNTPRGVYLTLFVAILDANGSMLRYVNAGHNPQFLLRAKGGIQPLSSTGMPIALFSGQGYTDANVEMGPGDLLFFYTDGLVETENDAGEMFGPERLQALLASEHHQSDDRVLDRVEAAVRTFRGKAEPFDDATMMALRLDP
jgi:serine phosphatase RsbU (regulator of sigma subunit)